MEGPLQLSMIPLGGIATSGSRSPIVATAFTHALVGAAAAQLAPAAVPRWRVVAAAALLAALPDLDIAAFSLGIPYAHPLGHRGFTHSLVFAAGAGLAAAWMLWGAGKPSGERRRIAAVLLAATASHGVLDAFTDRGLGVGFLIPFHSDRFFFPWRPLRTSPVSVEAFFSGRPLAILRNEILWVWLPLGLVWLFALLVRGRLRAGRKAQGAVTVLEGEGR